MNKFGVGDIIGDKYDCVCGYVSKVTEDNYYVFWCHIDNTAYIIISKELLERYEVLRTSILREEE